MKETEQVIIVELNGGNYYYNFDMHRLVEYNEYSYIPAISIKHTFEDKCDCGGSPFCNGKKKIRIHLLNN